MLWGAGCFTACSVLLLLFVFNGSRTFWLVPVLGLGLPTLALVLVRMGLLPNTRRVVVLVRLLPAGTMVRVEAVRTGSGFYRIVSRNSQNEPWEFSTGDTVRCTEQVLPNGDRTLVAVLRRCESS